VTPVVVLFVVLGTFAFVLHSVPLLIDDDYSFISSGLVSVHVVRRMSSAWL
jgi:hypothetical protein